MGCSSSKEASTPADPTGTDNPDLLAKDDEIRKTESGNEPDILEGFITKKGQVVKTWHNRWFVLEKGYLTYYTDTDRKVKKGEIFLKRMRVRVEGNNIFVEPTEEGSDRSIQLYRISQVQRDEWVSTIQKHIDYLENLSPGESKASKPKDSVASSNSVAEKKNQDLAEPDVMQGYINKRGQLIKTWRERWFHLEKGYLQYFVSNDMQIKKGEVCLKGMIARVDGSNILVEASNVGGDRNIILDIPVEADRDEWLKSIQIHTSFIDANSNVMTENPVANVESKDELQLNEEGCDPEVTEGYINKQGQLVKSWKKRWFLLKKGYITYFTDRDKKEKKGEICLKGMTVREEGTFIHIQTFEEGSDRNMLLEITDDMEREEWLNSIQTHISNWSAVSTGSFSMVESPMNTDEIREPILRQGFVHKQGHMVKSWKRRWFILEKGHVHYFVDADLKDKKGEVNLKNMTIRQEGTYVYIDTTEESEAVKGLILDFPTESDGRDVWIKSIQEHIDYLRAVEAAT